VVKTITVGGNYMEQVKKDEVLGKIKKLMALGMKHEDTPEGQSALHKAQCLMAKYDVRYIDVEDNGTVLDANMGRTDIAWQKKSNDFESHLAGHIARTFDCQYVICNSFNRTKIHVIIGTKTDMELAEWLFKFVRLQCYRLTEQHNYKGKELRNYLFGMNFTLCDRITATFGKVESEKYTESDCTALILVKSDAVKRKVAEIFPRLKKGRKSRPLAGSMDAYLNGTSDGNKVSLNKALNK